MAGEDLLVRVEGGVAVMTINRPEKGNTLTSSLLESLAAAVERLPSAGARCAVLTGAGDRFSLGMDLNAMAGLTPAENQRLIGPGGPLRRALRAIEDYPYPVVAMARGHAAGAACELAAACDLRVGGEGCLMGMPPARLGLVYPAEGIERFVRTFGLQVARRLFLTAGYFGAAELYAMGMLDFVRPDGELEEHTMELAGRLAANAPLSMKGHKFCLALLSARQDASAGAGERMGALVKEAMESADAAEGIRAFVEKREPRFKGE